MSPSSHLRGLEELLGPLWARSVVEFPKAPQHEMQAVGGVGRKPIVGRMSQHTVRDPACGSI